MIKLDKRLTRLSDAIWLKNVPQEFTIGGVGSIGSHLTFFLSRTLTGNSIVVLYDYDKVDEFNIGGQFFMASDVGMYKTTAIAEHIRNFASSVGTGFNHKHERYVAGSYTTPYCFSCFDAIRPRLDMFNNWVKLILTLKEMGSTDILSNAFFIDGRIEFEAYQVYVLLPDDVINNTPELERYKKTLDLSLDNKDNVGPCTLKNNTHIASKCANDMVEYYTHIVANANGDFRIIPFYHGYLAQTLDHEYSLKH